MAISLDEYAGTFGRKPVLHAMLVERESERPAASGAGAQRLAPARTLAFLVVADRDFPRDYKFCSWHVTIGAT
jgi:hypothetical protein